MKNKIEKQNLENDWFEEKECCFFKKSNEKTQKPTNNLKKSKSCCVQNFSISNPNSIISFQDDFEEDETFAPISKGEFQTEYERVLNEHDLLFKLKKSGLSLDAKKEEEKLLKHWAKTLLLTFNALPNIIEIVDTLVESRALSKNHTCGLNNCAESTYEQVQKVVDLVERKKSLICVFQMTESLLKTLDKNDQKLAQMRYIQRQSIGQIANFFGFQERSIFRIYDRFFSRAVLVLKKLKFSPEIILENVRSEPWLLRWF